MSFGMWMHVGFISEGLAVPKTISFAVSKHSGCTASGAGLKRQPQTWSWFEHLKIQEFWVQSFGLISNKA